MKFLSLFTGGKRRLAIRHVPNWSSLTLDEWRASDARTNFVRQMMEQPLCAALLGTLQNSMPMPRITSASFDAGVVQGYMLCLNNLILAAEPLESPALEMEATYERPVEDMIEPVET